MCEKMKKINKRENNLFDEGKRKVNLTYER